MLSVAEALDLILKTAIVLPAESVKAADAVGRVLAADVVSDVDSPPYDKSMMDGYAVRVADFDAGAAELDVLELIGAGALPTKPVADGQTTRVMTGAPIPEGADAVIMVERSKVIAGEDDSPTRVRLFDDSLTAGQNIMQQASSISADERVLPAETLLRPLDIGLACEAGGATPSVHRRPTVAVLSTGDELVDAAEQPPLGCIRNSNGPMLAASAAAAAETVVNLGAAKDDEEDLRKKISAGLASDVLLLSGGVSAGVFDLTPKVLAELGVEQVFHKVHLKPGKPLWFGRTRKDGRQVLIFGLPGNPVSTLVCFELFVRPTLKRLAGWSAADAAPRMIPGTLAVPHKQKGDRPTYHPSRVEGEQSGCLVVRPLDWLGSADLRGLSRANALTLFPAAGDFAEGADVEVYQL